MDEIFMPTIFKITLSVNGDELKSFEYEIESPVTQDEAWQFAESLEDFCDAIYFKGDDAAD